MSTKPTFDYRRFDKLIKKRGISVHDMGEVLGVSHATVTRWRRGEYPPTVCSLMLLETWSSVTAQRWMKWT